jgi:alkanesulfonate monooxygenase SsuD/methylene tetrahydromethanopterin reductase-like flavin-dependent oxidoreductase (luciferase family)
MEDAGAKIAGRFGGSRLEDLPEDLRSRIRTMMIIGDRDAVAEQVQELLDAGLDGVIFNLPDAHDLESVALAGEILATVLP